MNRRIVASAAAATVIGALLIVVLPQHAASIVRLAAATVAVVAGGLVLLAVAPVASQTPTESALDRAPTRLVAPLDPHGLRDARRDLDRPGSAAALPVALWERIVVATVLRMQRLGIDVDSPRTRDEARALLTPATWHLITSRPAPAATGRRDPEAVAGVVHRTLDELDSLTHRTGGAHGHR